MQRFFGRTTKTHHQIAHADLSLRWAHITKTYLYNVDSLKPHFYIVKLGIQGYTLFFLFLLKNIDCGYSLEPPCRGDSNEYTQYMFWAEIWKISEFLSEKFHFLVVKFSIYLNRHVFVTIRRKVCFLTSRPNIIKQVGGSTRCNWKKL